MIDRRHTIGTWHAILIAWVFLCMQLVAITHAAAHGEATHSHNGTPCLIQILTDSPNQGATIVCAVAPPTVNAAPAFPDNLVFASLSSQNAHPIRAPPDFSP